MDFKKVLRAFLLKVTKKESGDIDAILEASEASEDSTLKELLAIDKTRITELLAQGGDKFQEGYKKAKKEERTALEKEIKEKFDIETDATGAELVEEIVTAKTKTASKNAPVTEDIVKAHPVYQALEKGIKKQLNEAKTEYETKLKDAETGFKRSQVGTKVDQKAIEILDTMNPVYSTNPKVAANQKAAFLKAIKDGFDFDDQETGILIKKGDKVLDDGHGKTVEFDSFVKDRAADFFEFKQNNGGQNGGNGKSGDQGDSGAGGGAKYPANIVKPKTFEEVIKITNDDKIPVADRQIVLQTWETEQAAGTGN